MAKRQTLEAYMKDEGLSACKFSPDKKTLWIYSYAKRETWEQNDGHASFGVTYQGHDYEFCSSLESKLPQ